MNKQDLNNLKKGLIMHETLRGQDMTFETTWGLFSPREIDHGTRVLLDHIEVGEDDTILDLGCGYGPIGLTLAKESSTREVTMVDTNAIAIRYASRNAEINRCKNTHIYVSNAFESIEDFQTFDTIISNIPAKVGNEMLQIMLHDAYDHLMPGGRLYVVVIGGLKEYIKRNFKEIFGNYKKVKQSGTYTVSMAVKE